VQVVEYTPLLRSVIIKEPLRILVDSTARVFVLYSQKFFDIQETIGLPDGYIHTWAHEGVAARAPVPRTVPFRQADMISRSEPPKSAPELAPVVITFARDLCAELVKQKKQFMPLLSLVFNKKLRESAHKFQREIEEFSKVEDLHERATKGLQESTEVSSIVSSTVDKLKRTLTYKDEMQTCYEAKATLNNLQLLSDKLADDRGSVASVPPVLIQMRCGHNLSPHLVTKKALEKKKRMGRGPMQLLCEIENCGTIFDDKELLQLLGDKFMEIAKDYNEEPLCAPGMKMCMLCAKENKAECVFWLHKNHSVCNLCLKQYLYILSQRKPLALDERSLGTECVARLQSVRCPARGCKFKFGDDFIRQVFRPSEYNAALETALKLAGVPDVESVMMLRKELDKQNEPSKMFLCALEKRERRVDETIGLWYCDHYLCLSCMVS
jgi:hypothetical protein